MKTKKILLVLQLPPPVHGASTMNKHVVESKLIQSNFQTEIVNLQFARNMTEIERFSFRKLGLAFYYATLILFRLIKFKPDLVYFTIAPRGFAFYRDIMYGGIMKLFGKKLVYHLHGKGMARTSNRNVLIRSLCRWIFKDAHVICLSARLVQDIEGFYEGTPYIVPNGISADRSPQFAAQSSTTPNILYLSNYIEQKGILILIEALKVLSDQGLAFKARLVGAPGDLTLARLKKIVTDLGMEKQVEIVGPRYGDEKIREFEAADIFVFPTFYENEAFPLVNLEAMQFGLPVISTTEGGIPDMLTDGESGFVIEPRNFQVLAEKIGVLLNNKELMVSMGKNGHTRFKKHFTLEHFNQNLNNTFLQILGSTIN